MKLILSRKGFDSTAGGVPSPIFPDGRMLALPIPDADSEISYGDISDGSQSIAELVHALTKGRITAEDKAHLDPDLIRHSLPRQRNWRPVFGQKGAAQSHLRNQGVGPGDLFLFFGLFRQLERIDGEYRWQKDAQPRHVLWGWMQIDELIPVDSRQGRNCRWAHYHPHFHQQDAANNVLYTARKRLSIDGGERSITGAGVFPAYSAERQLTSPDAQLLTQWRLPGWMHPARDRKPLSYHTDKKRWKRRGNHTELQAVARGQEFVLDCADYPQAERWAFELISAGNCCRAKN